MRRYSAAPSSAVVAVVTTALVDTVAAVVAGVDAGAFGVVATVVTGGADELLTAVADAGAPPDSSSSTCEFTNAAAEPAASTPPIDSSIATRALGAFIPTSSPATVGGRRPAGGQATSKNRPTSFADSANRAGGRRAVLHNVDVKLLLVEDDRAIAESLVSGLQADGHEVNHVATGAAALTATGYDLVLLDLGLPDIDGRDVCRQLRQRGSVPIIMLTARGDEFDRVLGLELGADDYVTKPFSRRELSARIRAVGRRTAQPAQVGDGGQDADGLTVGALQIDRRSRRAHLDGEELSLTAKEFDVLAYLAAEPGRGVQPHGDPRAGVGRQLVRPDEDRRRPRRRPAPQARRPSLDRGGARRRVPARGASVRWRLLAAFLGVMVVMLVAQDVPLVSHLRRVEVDRQLAELERDAFLLAGQAASALSSPDGDGVIRRIRRLGRPRRHRDRLRVSQRRGSCRHRCRWDRRGRG